jgi:hypothetical protein
LTVRSALLLVVLLSLPSCFVMVPFIESDYVEPAGRQYSAGGQYKRPVRTKSSARAQMSGDRVTQLVQQLHHSSVLVRAYAAFDLGELGPRASSAVPALVTALEKDEAKHVRRASAKALGKIGDAACPARPALRRGLNDRDRYVAGTAENALKKLHAYCS